MQDTKPKRIAVLGGGLAAMTSVFHLLQDPDWDRKYDITIYQMGWRIGGKGASGVNPEKGFRIEEHGLHLWMGFYENAFWMMRQVYEALGREKGTPLADFDAAFKGQPYMIFAEQVNQQWLDWQIGFPTLEGKVGDGHCGDFELLLDSMLHDIFRHIKEWLEEKKISLQILLPVNALRSFYHLFFMIQWMMCWQAWKLGLIMPWLSFSMW